MGCEVRFRLHLADYSSQLVISWPLLLNSLGTHFTRFGTSLWLHNIMIRRYTRLYNPVREKNIRELNEITTHIILQESILVENLNDHLEHS
jgi:hypothetical protein